ncbi:MAG: hypothetical protein IKU10_02470, partial [Clostridia bacterium]|nr:hypothetical protein [Clostridia bacterium]
FMLLLSMSAFAFADEVEVTANEEGYENILFSNDYRGFCVDEGLEGAKVNDQFTVRPASELLSNKTEQNIANQFKVMMTKGFHSFFEKDGNGIYGITPYGIQLAQRVAWYYTDAYVSANFKDDIEKLVQQVDLWVAQGVTVADTGYVFEADDSTKIQMDFALLNTQTEGQQCFFAYKMTQTPIVHEQPSQPETPTNPEPNPSQPQKGAEETPTDMPDSTPPVTGSSTQPSTATDSPVDSPLTEQPIESVPKTGEAAGIAVGVLVGCMAAVGLVFLSNRKSR